jgi:hypothetical protein
VRLVRPPRRERALRIHGTLAGRGISPLQFDALDIPVFAQPQFETDAQLRSNPSESIKAGERVAYEVLLRNGGDGPAERLILRAMPSNLAVYVPGSTTLNGMVIPDDLGTSQLWSQRGLVLTDVNPGIELRVRWEMLVIAPLAAGTPIDTRVVADWDGERSLALAAPTLHVLSAPSLEAGIGGTPISVANLTPALEAPEPEAIVPPPFAPEPEPEPQAQEPAPQPVAEQEPVPVADAAEAPEEVPAVPAIAAPALEAAPKPFLYADFAPGEIAQTIRTLEKSDGGGLIPHFFAVRALLPVTVAGDERLSAILDEAVRALRAPLDRFFVRLRAPNLTVAGKDLEDRDSRFALRGLLAALGQATEEQPRDRAPGTVRIGGRVDVEALQARLPELEQAPLGSVTPWIAAAELMGSQIEYDGQRSEVPALYRAALLKVFGVLETLPMPEFHRIAATSVNRTLDDALGAVVDALRAASHVAVD